MLVNFSIENCTSFKEKSTLSLERTKIKQHPGHILSNNLLSGAVIYGANASGKTNFLQSLHLLSRIIGSPFMSSQRQVMSFLNENMFNRTSDSTTKFEVAFIKSDTKYLYSISIFKDHIQDEKFYFWQNNRRYMLFERKDLKIKYGKTLSSSWYNKDKTVRTDTPLLSALDAFYGLIAHKIEGYQHFNNAIDFFRNIEYINEKSLTLGEKFYDELQKEEFKTFLVKLLKLADLGIRDVEFVPVPNSAFSQIPPWIVVPEGKTVAQVSNDRLFIFTKQNGIITCQKLVTRHEGCDTFFELGHESAGTQKIIHLSLSLFMQKNMEKILLLDELDSLLHPSITKALLTLLLNTDSKGQIIVAMHNTNLLTHDIWRVDEIWFTEKNSIGESRIYPLTDINPRFDKNLEKDYINGKYGAIPFTGGIEQWLEIVQE